MWRGAQENASRPWVARRDDDVGTPCFSNADTAETSLAEGIKPDMAACPAEAEEAAAPESADADASGDLLPMELPWAVGAAASSQSGEAADTHRPAQEKSRKKKKRPVAAPDGSGQPQLPFGVRRWLRAQQIEELGPVFAAEGLDSFATIAMLAKDDVAALAGSVGARLHLQRGVERLRDRERARDSAESVMQLSILSAAGGSPAENSTGEGPGKDSPERLAATPQRGLARQGDGSGGGGAAGQHAAVTGGSAATDVSPERLHQDEPVSDGFAPGEAQVASRASGGAGRELAAEGVGDETAVVSELVEQVARLQQQLDDLSQFRSAPSSSIALSERSVPCSATEGPEQVGGNVSVHISSPSAAYTTGITPCVSLRLAEPALCGNCSWSRRHPTAEERPWLRDSAVATTTLGWQQRRGSPPAPPPMAAGTAV